MPNSELNDKELVRAKNTAYRYLSYRPRSRAEVEARLLEKLFSEMVVRAVMLDLERLGYVDDSQFAGQWARSRTRLRGFGRRRIERELRDKGVSGEIIRETIAAVFEDKGEEQIAFREAEKKLKTLARFETETRRRRLAGFLERKGFSFEIIRSILKRA